MRYLVQFVIPALIFVGVVYLLARERRPGGAQRSGSDAGPMLAILALGAVVAVAAAYALTIVLE